MILIFAILSFFSFCRGGARPLLSGARGGRAPGCPPLVASLLQNKACMSYVGHFFFLDQFGPAKPLRSKIIIRALNRTNRIFQSMQVYPAPNQIHGNQDTQYPTPNQIPTAWYPGYTIFYPNHNLTPSYPGYTICCS